MEPAAREFTEFLSAFEFKALEIPIISNITARPYPTENPTETIKALLIEQITQPVQWTDSIRYLLSQDETEFEEIGPGTVLTGLIRRIRKEATPLTNTEIAEETARIEATATTDTSPHLWDNLQQIKGIGPKTESLLNEKGVTTFHMLAKVSRPEVATVFMQPAPQHYVDKLVAAGHITPEEAELSQFIPMSEDICVEADSGGHTDQGVAYALMPAMLSLRDEMMAQYNYTKPIRVGATGGIGTPEAAAAAFMLGAEFILTGSINQCTVEAGMSDVVKDILQGINVQDTAYAPAGDMFELGAKSTSPASGCVLSSPSQQTVHPVPAT